MEDTETTTSRFSSSGAQGTRSKTEITSSPAICFDYIVASNKAFFLKLLFKIKNETKQQQKQQPRITTKQHKKISVSIAAKLRNSLPLYLY